MATDYSIVIPAYNEAVWLPKTLTAANEAMRSIPLKGEIIVCNNNSTDATAQCAQAMGAKVVFEPYNQISRARNTGARHAAGRYLVFVDADTIIPADLLREALARLQSGQCCGGGAVVAFDDQIPKTGAAGLRLWNWLSVHMGLAAGCFVYCTRQDFEALKGFSESVYASEEIWFSRQLKRLGRRRGQVFCVIENYPVVSSGRKMEWFGMTRQVLLFSMLVFFPFLVRFKRFCRFWYYRPS